MLLLLFRVGVPRWTRRARRCRKAGGTAGDAREFLGEGINADGRLVEHGARVFAFPRVWRGHRGEDEVSAAEAFVEVPRARPEGLVGAPDVVRFGGADNVEDGEGDNAGGMVEFATEGKIGAPRGIWKTGGRVGDAGRRRHRGEEDAFEGLTIGSLNGRGVGRRC